VPEAQNRLCGQLPEAVREGDLVDARNHLAHSDEPRTRKRPENEWFALYESTLTLLALLAMTESAYSRRCNFVHFDAVLQDEQCRSQRTRDEPSVGQGPARLPIVLGRVLGVLCSCLVRECHGAYGLASRAAGVVVRPCPCCASLPVRDQFGSSQSMVARHTNPARREGACRRHRWAHLLRVIG
jgi:hypothetical protein